jgi:hypothetical protein
MAVFANVTGFIYRYYDTVSRFNPLAVGFNPAGASLCKCEQTAISRFTGKHPYARTR